MSKLNCSNYHIIYNSIIWISYVVINASKVLDENN